MGLQQTHPEQQDIRRALGLNRQTVHRIYIRQVKAALDPQNRQYPSYSWILRYIAESLRPILSCLQEFP